MAVFYAIVLLLWGSIYIYQPILAVYAQNMGASMGLLGTIVGAYGFTQLLLRIPIGIWSDRVGARKPFIVGALVIGVVSAVGMALASDPHLLVVWRASAGVAASTWVVFAVLFAGSFPREKTTSAMASLAVVTGASEMISTYSGGVIAQNWGWHAPFYVGIVLALLGLVAALRLPEKRVPGHPMGLRDLLRIGTTPLLVAISLVSLLSSWTQWVTMYGFTPVYAAGLGADRAELGLLTAIAQGCIMIGALACPYFTDRIGGRVTVIAALLIQAAGALLVPFVNSLWLVGVSQVLTGYGRGFLRPVLMADSIHCVPEADRATAMGVFQAAYAVGMFIGPATTGLLGDAFGISSIFFVGGLVSLLGIPVVAIQKPSKG